MSWHLVLLLTCERGEGVVFRSDTSLFVIFSLSDASSIPGCLLWSWFKSELPESCIFVIVFYCESILPYTLIPMARTQEKQFKEEALF